MILRGIMDYSFGGIFGGILCIRGFARLSDLEQVSKADADYQRDLIASQKKIIEEFLKNSEYLFFPEVILSYKISEVDKIQQIYSRGNFVQNLESSKGKLKITSRKQPYKGVSDSRGKTEVRIATINMPEEKIFHRIDGNHRLSAAEEFKDNTIIADLEAPFCLILLPKDKEKFEKTIFHNINFKHIPLTEEEHLKVIFGGDTFSDKELQDNFGEEYSKARNFLKQYEDESKNYAGLPNLERISRDKKREILVKSFRLFSEKRILDEVNATKLWEAFNHVESIYSANKKLSENPKYGLLIAFLYFYFKMGNKNSLKAFVKWIVDNCIYEIAEDDASSIVNIYGSLQEKRKKTIFVSMAFGQKNSRPHYKAIKGVIDQTNKKYDLKISLRAIRMDMFETGYSYDITSEILKQIDECGFFIADLSFKNVNVYHELGYLMGQNKERNQENNNFLLLMKEGQNDTETNNAVGFNIAGYKQIRFENTEKLRTELEKAIIEYYDLQLPSGSATY